MLGLELSTVCFNAFESISPVIEFDGGWHVDLIGVFPSVVTFGVSLPFDEILQGLVTFPSLVTADLFHFVFFFPINQIKGRSGEVWSM
jgi:hypothetical protein